MNYYLKFTIDDIHFAAPIEEIKEVARPRSIHQPKKSFRNVAGLFELRRQKFMLYDLPGFLSVGSTKKFEVIVSSIENKTIGFKVDKVLGIITSEYLKPFPDLARTGQYFQGVIAEDESFVQVLSFRKILSGQRWQALKKHLSAN